jgi:hypothetical protein
MTLSFPDDASKYDMAGGCIDRLRMARGGAVAPAIRRKQMRAAFELKRPPLRTIHPKLVDGNAVGGRFFGKVSV